MRYFEIFPSESLGDWYYLRDIESHASLRFNHKEKVFELINSEDDWDEKTLKKFRKTGKDLKKDNEKRTKEMDIITKSHAYKKLKPVIKWYFSCPFPILITSEFLYSPNELILKILEKYPDEFQIKTNNLKKVRDSLFEAYFYESDELRHKGYKLLFNGNFSEAINIFNECLSFYPEDNISLHSIAEALVKLKRYEEAIEYSEKSIKVISHDFEAWKTKGLGLIEIGKFKEAIIAFDEYTSLNPADKEVFLYKAEALCKLGNIKEAINSYKEVLVKDPNNELALSALNKLKTKS